MLIHVILFVTGLLVGSMNAIAGGGMLIGLPIMIGFGHIPAIAANATASLTLLPGGLSSAFGYRKEVRKVPKTYILLLLPALAGAAIGANLLRHTKASDFARIVPFLLIFAVVLFAFQPYLYSKTKSHIVKPKSKNKDLKPVLLVCLGLFPLAIYGGFFGAGFGFVMLAFLGFTGLHSHLHRMNAVKNLVSASIAAASIACLYTSHLIRWEDGLIMACGGVIGGYLASTYVQKVSSHILRVMVIVIGIGAAIYLGIRK